MNLRKTCIINEEIYRVEKKEKKKKLSASCWSIVIIWLNDRVSLDLWHRVSIKKNITYISIKKCHPRYHEMTLAVNQDADSIHKFIFNTLYMTILFYFFSFVTILYIFYSIFFFFMIFPSLSSISFYFFLLYWIPSTEIDQSFQIDDTRVKLMKVCVLILPVYDGVKREGIYCKEKRKKKKLNCCWY